MEFRLSFMAVIHRSMETHDSSSICVDCMAKLRELEI
jgi:hypothetical protein